MQLLFDGITYSPEHDSERLTGQLRAVMSIMRDGKKRTLDEIIEGAELLTGRRCGEAAISARIRDLRKDRYGSHDIRSERRTGGVWVYWEKL